MKILNLTQHSATPDQLNAGVVDLPPTDKAWVQRQLTFDGLKDVKMLKLRAGAIATLASVKAGTIYDGTYVMIGGAGFFMASLEDALLKCGITPLHAFSARVSEESVVDGVTTKVNIFKHIGFVEVFRDDDGVKYYRPYTPS